MFLHRGPCANCGGSGEKEALSLLLIFKTKFCLLSMKFACISVEFEPKILNMCNANCVYCHFSRYLSYVMCTDLVYGGVPSSSGCFQAFVCTLSGFHMRGGHWNPPLKFENYDVVFALTAIKGA